MGVIKRLDVVPNPKNLLLNAKLHTYLLSIFFFMVESAPPLSYPPPMPHNDLCVLVLALQMGLLGLGNAP